MSIDSVEVHKQKLEKVLGSSSELFTTDDFDIACETALNELGWAYPILGFRESYWVMERTKRHALDLLRTGSAHKFKYKQINLNHRFEHYHKLIESLDRMFLESLDSDPALNGLSAEELFGDYLGNNIQHDSLGRDISHLLYPSDD